MSGTQFSRSHLWPMIHLAPQLHLSFLSAFSAAEKLCGICNRAGDCLSRWVWIEASKAMFGRLDEITVESLIANKKELIAETYEDVQSTTRK